jgi:C4-dicarboxylate transporter, DctM subunit
MELMTVGIIGLCFMLLLIAIGVPIGFSLVVTGAVGMWYVAGITPTLAQIGMIAWDKGTDFVIVAVPLYILMGQLVFHSGIAADLYDCVQKWFGRLPGGLAIASVLACAAFGAVTGSSLAAVATMGAIVMPEMRRYKYDDRLATGVLSASGTLGILIPPSVIFIFYGIMTDTSIAALFIAGIIPGIITTIFYSLLIYLRCRANPKLGPAGPAYSWAERIASTKEVTPVAIVFLAVIGGIYGGIFTPTEASGIGVSGVFLCCLVMGRLSWEKIKLSLHDTGVISAMIFAILIGGYLFGRFLALTEITSTLVNVIVSWNLNRYVFMAALMLLFIILGSVLDVFGMLILTLPFIFPVTLELGYDPVWLGVFTVIMAEIALVTPPIGVNVFIMKNIAKDVPLETIFRGILPFVLCDLLLVVLLVTFPSLALWLPSTLK